MLGQSCLNTFQVKVTFKFFKLNIPSEKEQFWSILLFQSHFMRYQ